MATGFPQARKNASPPESIVSAPGGWHRAAPACPGGASRLVRHDDQRAVSVVVRVDQLAAQVAELEAALRPQAPTTAAGGDFEVDVQAGGGLKHVARPAQ